MLANHSSARKVLNTDIDSVKCVDYHCDLNDDDVDDDDEDNCDQCTMVYSSLSPPTVISLNGSTAMSTSKKSTASTRQRPHTLNLRSIGYTRTPSTDGNEHVADVSEADGRKRHQTTKHITIGFENIIYEKLLWNRKTKTILNGLNGEFRAGELTAIMGPSGAGKSTFMDILSGYTKNSESGSITINGRPRDLKLFRRQTAYIMQDHVLQSFVTVWEAMNFAVNLKIGNVLTHPEKKARIHQILDAIGMYDVRNTRSGQLSGGQRKRLSIALELVDNPPVMFFDEPTSGLDSSTSTQVVLLLKQLAKEGRTIVCTIHQPSAMVFSLFDHLYGIADGKCIYAGHTSSLVPFLAELDLICPTTYNPSDYLLEISTNDYGPHNDRLIAKIRNGKETGYRKSDENSEERYALETAEKMMKSGVVTPIKAPALLPMKASPMAPVIESPSIENCPKKPKIISFHLDAAEFCRNEGTYATSFCRQWYLLILRSFMCLYRDKSLAALRLCIHMIVGTLVGTLYFGIGNDASMIFNNFRYIFMSIMFLMFTSFSSMTIMFPLEVAIVTREHFNRWYSVKAYYFALTFADLPIQIACVTIFVIITYLMTAQPLEWFRFGIFYAIICLVTLVSQGWGMIIGAVCDVKHAHVIGPFVIAPFLVFSGFFLRFSDAHPALHWLFHISYLKHALEGSVLAIFGYDRPKMECDEMYCHYRIPKKFMETIDMHEGNILSVAIILIGICVLLRIVAYYAMYIRVKRR